VENKWLCFLKAVIYSHNFTAQQPTPIFSNSPTLTVPKQRKNDLQTSAVDHAESCLSQQQMTTMVTSKQNSRIHWKL